jgi:hypothetical protein
MAHLAFLIKDFEKSKICIEKAKAEKYIPVNVGIQIRLMEVLLSLYESPQITPEAEQKIPDLFRFIDKNKDKIANAKTMKSNLALWLSNRFIAEGKVAKGVLMLSYYYRDFGTYSYFMTKNLYHRLYDIGKPQDYVEILDLINKKNKNTFERFITANPRAYNGERVGDEALSKLTEQEQENGYDKYGYYVNAEAWDVNKIKDYYATYYVVRDQLDSAYAIFKTVPDAYWDPEKRFEYHYATGYPFGDYAYRSLDEESTSLNKRTFIKRILELKKSLQTKPQEAAKTNYYLGLAYYSMTYHGEMWLMSRIWQSGDEMTLYGEENCDDRSFMSWYLGSKRAQDYFVKAMRGTKEIDLAAAAGLWANICENDYKAYDWNSKHAKCKLGDKSDNYTDKAPEISKAYISELVKIWGKRRLRKSRVSNNCSQFEMLLD